MHKKSAIIWSTIAVAFLGLALLVLWNQTHPAQEDSMTAEAAATPDPNVEGMLRQVNRDRALNDLRQLSGEIPICVSTGCNTIADRKTGSVGLGWATDYLYQNLTSLGYQTEFWNWSAAGYSDRNVIAGKLGVVTPNEEIYIVAHIDGVKLTEARYPAADDNASGVVDLLELARALKDRAFQRTIVLLFSTGEEQGRRGVEAYFDHLSPEERSRIKYAVDIDMIGFDGNDDHVMELWHGGDRRSMALTQVMSDVIRAYGLALDPRMVTGCG